MEAVVVVWPQERGTHSAKLFKVIAYVFVRPQSDNRRTSRQVLLYFLFWLGFFMHPRSMLFLKTAPGRVPTIRSCFKKNC